MMSPEQTLVIGESPPMIGGSLSIETGGSVEVPLVIDETPEPLVTEQVTEPSTTTAHDSFNRWIDA
jgi:hypothetical protein